MNTEPRDPEQRLRAYLWKEKPSWSSMGEKGLESQVPGRASKFILPSCVEPWGFRGPHIAKSCETGHVLGQGSLFQSPTLTPLGNLA
jgi:hypothetical protein